MAASDKWLDGKNINLTLLPMEYFCVNFVWSQELKLFPAITTRNTKLVILIYFICRKKLMSIAQFVKPVWIKNSSLPPETFLIMIMNKMYFSNSAIMSFGNIFSMEWFLW